MDGLNNHQRALAWLASWNPSFAGKAIVNADFTFRSVNEQFCKILRMMPSDFLNSSFTDLTQEPMKTLDRQNADLVVQGRSPGYIMRKQYQRHDGTLTPEFMLMVVGVFKKNGDFDFFVSRIILATEAEDDTQEHAQSLKGSSLWVKFITALPLLMKLAGGIAAAVGVMAWVLYEMTKLAAKEGFELWP